MDWVIRRVMRIDFFGYSKPSDRRARCRYRYWDLVPGNTLIFAGSPGRSTSRFLLKKWVQESLPLQTVEDRSPDHFVQWVRAWSTRTGIVLNDTAAAYHTEPSRLTNWKLTDRTVPSGPGESFLLTLRPQQKNRFRSGDLLAVYPAGDHRERFYSVARVGKKVQLLVKHYESGFGSTYLNALRTGDRIKARIIQNPAFHFPRHAGSVILYRKKIFFSE